MSNRSHRMTASDERPGIRPFTQLDNDYLDKVTANLPPTRAILLIHLLRRIGANESCWPSVQNMADSTSIAPRTVHRALDDLVKAGWITVQSESGKDGKTSHYTVLACPIEDEPIRHNAELVEVKEDRVCQNGRGGSVTMADKVYTREVLSNKTLVKPEADLTRPQAAVFEPDVVVTESSEPTDQHREMFEAVYYIQCGKTWENGQVLSKPERGKLNQFVGQFRDLGDIDELRRRYKNYQTNWPGRLVNARSLLNAWGQCETGQLHVEGSTGQQPSILDAAEQAKAKYRAMTRHEGTSQDARQPGRLHD